MQHLRLVASPLPGLPLALHSVLSLLETLATKTEHFNHVLSVGQELISKLLLAAPFHSLCSSPLPDFSQ